MVSLGMEQATLVYQDDASITWATQAGLKDSWKDVNEKQQLC